MKVIPEGFTRSAIGLLTEFDFPGNVRQLVQRCRIRAGDVSGTADRRASFAGIVAQAVDSLDAVAVGIGMGVPGRIRRCRRTCSIRHKFRMCPIRHPRPLPMDGPKANDSQKISFKKFVQDAEADAIHKALDKHNWVVAEVARELNISRTVLYERMKAYGIKRPERGLASPVQPQLPGEVPAG